MQARDTILGGIALIAATTAASGAHSAEFGASPWLKGYTDYFGGVVPPIPGVYFRSDVYNYSGEVARTIFNGRIDFGVEQNYTATIAALNIVTPWTLFGGVYSIAIAPTFVAMDVDVALGIPAFTGPLGVRRGGFIVNGGDTNLALGDTVFAPVYLGWNEGNFHWSAALFALAPTGDYSTSQLANTSLNHWSIMPRFAATYFDPQTGWQATGAVVYTWNFENEATNYLTGDILNFEGTVTKAFGQFAFGVAGYGMVQTTGDSGAGARLGAFKSEVYGLGPIATFTTGPDPTKAATIIVKWYHEFGAKNAFEGDTVDAAVSFKF